MVPSPKYCRLSLQSSSPCYVSVLVPSVALRSFWCFLLNGPHRSKYNIVKDSVCSWLVSSTPSLLSRHLSHMYTLVIYVTICLPGQSPIFSKKQLLVPTWFCFLSFIVSVSFLLWILICSIPSNFKVKVLIIDLRCVFFSNISLNAINFPLQWPALITHICIKGIY